MLQEISHLISHFNDIFNALSTKDLIFPEFQEANQQSTAFKEDVRNTRLLLLTQNACSLLLQCFFSLQFKTFNHNF